MTCSFRVFGCLRLFFGIPDNPAAGNPPSAAFTSVEAAAHLSASDSDAESSSPDPEGKHPDPEVKHPEVVDLTVDVDPSASASDNKKSGASNLLSDLTPFDPTNAGATGSALSSIQAPAQLPVSLPLSQWGSFLIDTEAELLHKR